MYDVEKHKHFAIFKEKGYFIGYYSEDTLNLLEKDKGEFKTEYEGKVKSINQLWKVRELIEEVNKSREKLNIKKLEAILESEEE